MKTRDYRDYLQDIINAINDIESFTVNMTFADFTKDKKTINAVVRSIEIIGEATKKIPKSLKNGYPSIPWKKMAGIRDKMIHEYFGVDLESVYKTIREDIPPLKPLIKNILKSL